MDTQDAMVMAGPALFGFIMYIFRQSLVRNLNALDSSVVALQATLKNLEEKQIASNERVVTSLARSDAKLSGALQEIGNLKARVEKQDERINRLSEHWRQEFSDFLKEARR